MRILIIEDNQRLARLVEQGIAPFGFRCDLAGRLDDAELALESLSYDALVLDLSLPDGDGLDWLVAQKRKADLPPVLVMSCRSGLDDRVTALDSGADDYLVKPADTAEIAARLRALLRRTGPCTSTVLAAGSLRFDTAARTLHCADAEILLTHKEAELVELLMRRAGTVVRKSAIADTLCRLDEEITLNAVEASVSRLRQKLSVAGGGSALVTVRGVGYMLKDAKA